MWITDIFLCPEAQTLMHCQPLLVADIDYLRTDYFPCHNHVLIVDIVNSSNNDTISLGLSRRIT